MVRTLMRILAHGPYPNACMHCIRTWKVSLRGMGLRRQAEGRGRSPGRRYCGAGLSTVTVAASKKCCGCQRQHSRDEAEEEEEG